MADPHPREPFSYYKPSPKDDTLPPDLRDALASLGTMGYQELHLVSARARQMLYERRAENVGLPRELYVPGLRCIVIGISGILDGTESAVLGTAPEGKGKKFRVTVKVPFEALGYPNGTADLPPQCVMVIAGAARV